MHPRLHFKTPTADKKGAPVDEVVQPRFSDGLPGREGLGGALDGEEEERRGGTRHGGRGAARHHRRQATLRFDWWIGDLILRPGDQIRAFRYRVAAICTHFQHTQIAVQLVAVTGVLEWGLWDNRPTCEYLHAGQRLAELVGPGLAHSDVEGCRPGELAGGSGVKQPHHQALVPW